MTVQYRSMLEENFVCQGSFLWSIASERYLKVTCNQVLLAVTVVVGMAGHGFEQLQEARKEQ